MNILDIIAKKRDKKILSKEEIEFFVQQYTKGNITDYQAAALIMAIYINGMNKEETTFLTLAMANSGDILDLSTIGKEIVDKHSTGGVGDKISLILLPTIASLGVSVAKMSGRGLGFTGGTVDKLESIPGYKTNIDEKEFIKNVKEIGISMISQTMDIAPADKKIYGLRDSISSVENISLIASSIMSKKIASGANKIVLDVTVGSGAFMKNIEQARTLAKEMIEIGNLVEKETVCILTNMEEPLGYSVGNTLEIIEAINALKGNLSDDVKEVVLSLGSYMMKLAGINDNIEANKTNILKNLENGTAYNKFIELVERQGGDISYIRNIEKFKKAKYIEPIYSLKSGFIEEINAEKIGKLACFLGAGRLKKEDSIDNAVGIVFSKKVGDQVKKGDILAFIHANSLEKLEIVKESLLQDISISQDNVGKYKSVIEIIN